jgi:hypothetical protein
MSATRIPSATIQFALQSSLTQRAFLRLPRSTQCLRLGSRASCSWVRNPVSRYNKVPSGLRSSSVLQIERAERFSTSIIRKVREDSTSAPKTPQVGRIYVGCITSVTNSRAHVFVYWRTIKQLKTAIVHRNVSAMHEPPIAR